ncbi:NAD(P)/FAD-dependent oxidoreductase [Pontibacillus litoralis]|uniref:FAD/NAD(P)-binding domain-containing protein n=1 Tax=Pontibacillus litoralis JSM 072002 TaxID=1385512 RepID=A0A0A5G606_9BACI|nr:FAD-dependent oxidoreductase [Pontibacillus litoralis]KGX87479.1 hypothetical protein N784_14635 [Pontibacillus litoralis JSM 072002]
MKQLILIGAGHAHLHIIQQWIKQPIKNVALTVISPSPFHYYSGMMSGYAEGIYNEEDIRIDVKALVEKEGATFHQEAVMSIDPRQKILLTDKGKVLSYDVVSFNIGSLTAQTDRHGVKQYALRIKPNFHFTNMIDKLRNSRRPVIVGGDMEGIELALAIQAWRRNQHLSTPITLINRSSYMMKAHKQLQHRIRQYNITLQLNEEIEKVHSKKLITKDGEKIDYDEVLWLTGPRAPELFRLSHLPTDESGYLQVTSTLQVKSFPSIFGAGDCITLSDYPNLPKNEGQVVKQAPILWENINGFLTNGEGSHFKPNKRFISIMSTGNKHGLFLYGSFIHHSKLAWKIKHIINQTYMKKLK